MTNKEERIKMLMQQRKRGGWTGFWSIREEAAEWGYDLAVADMHGLLCQLSEEEKKLPVIQKLVGFFGWLDKTAEDDTPGTRLIVTLSDIDPTTQQTAPEIDV